jgi:hypothetical protein
VTRFQFVNRYSYNREGLYIPYALANFLTLIAVAVALISYKMSGVQPDARFDNIVSAAENPALIYLVRNPEKHRRRTIRVTVGDNGETLFTVAAGENESRRVEDAREMHSLIPLSPGTATT